MDTLQKAARYKTQLSSALKYSALLYLAWLCMYQFQPFLSGVQMWRDCSTVLNSAAALGSGDLPYRDFLYPLSPVSLLWPALFVKLFGATVFSFLLAQTLANITILLCAYGMVQNLGRRLGAEAPLYNLFAILWLQRISSVFLNKMQLPFYNYDWLFWLALAAWFYTRLIRHSAEAFKSKRAELILFHAFGILAVLSNPKLPFLPVLLLWFSLAWQQKSYKAPIAALGILAGLLLLHSRLSDIPELDKLLKRSDGFYAAYNLLSREGIMAALEKIRAQLQHKGQSIVLLLLFSAYLIYRKAFADVHIAYGNRSLPLRFLLLSTAALYLVSAFFTRSEHAPFFEYGVLCFICLFAILARGIKTLNLHSILMLAMFSGLFEATDFFGGKQGPVLSHVRETSMLKRAHYRCSGMAFEPQSPAARFAVLADSSEWQYRRALQPFERMPGFMHLSQPNYPYFLINNTAALGVTGLPFWFDTHLSTNAEVRRRLLEAIKQGRVQVLQLDRFSVHFEGHRFALDILKAIPDATGRRVECVFKTPMPGHLKGDSSFVYRLSD